MSNQVQLYIVAGLEMLVPIFALIFLYRKHKFRISAVIAGIAANFLAIQILVGSVATGLNGLGMDSQYWNDHELIYALVYTLSNVIMQNVIIYLIMRFSLKTNLKLYDAIAMAIAFGFVNCMKPAIDTVSFGRLAYLGDAGRLQEMVTETLTMDSLQQIYDQFIEIGGATPFYLEVASLLVQILMTVCFSILIYLAIKKKKQALKFLGVAMGAHALMLFALVTSQNIGGDIWFIAANVVCAAISIIFLVRFGAWYKQQRINLIERRKAYKDGLKSGFVTRENVGQSSEQSEEETDAVEEE